MEEIYTISMEKLKEYIKEENCMPNEKAWNCFAVEKNLLSSRSISYLSGVGFNTLCRKIMKQINKEKREL